MDDLAEFEAANTRPGPTSCKMHRAIARMDDDQRDRFRRAVESSHIQSSAIARVIVGWGLGEELKAEDVARYRRHLAGTGGCSCPAGDSDG